VRLYGGIIHESVSRVEEVTHLSPFILNAMISVYLSLLVRLVGGDHWRTVYVALLLFHLLFIFNYYLLALVRPNGLDIGHDFGGVDGDLIVISRGNRDGIEEGSDQSHGGGTGE
jgi:hypothetical protein